MKLRTRELKILCEGHALGHYFTRRKFLGAASATLASAVFPSVSLWAEQPQASVLAKDRHRPRYHLMPPSLWLNDPNGPLQFRGRYHLFYQYAPVISNMGTKYWGHAVSTDLVHWKNLGIAIAPIPDGPDKNGCWSGSAVVVDGIPTIVYTGATWSAESERAERAKGIIPERQMVAVAADPNDPNLTNWIKIPENPVLKAPPEGMKVTGWRDPALWKEGDTWYMIIGSGEAGKGGMALLYSSKDIKHWTYLHPFAVAKPELNQNHTRPGGSMWECPDFFLIDGKPMLMVARGNSYLTGTYANLRFEQEGRVDYGSAAYAQKTMEDEKGRRLWWAWLREKRSSEAQVAAGWAGVMSLPKLLTLRKDGLLGVEPVPELRLLRRSQKKLPGQRVQPNGPLLLKDVASDCAEIELEIELGDARQAGLRVRAAADGSEQTLIGYDRDAQELFSDTTVSSKDSATEGGQGVRAFRGIERGKLALANQEPLRLRVYLDASVIEIFANSRASISDRVYPMNPATLGVGLFATV
jgi:beta-fructofuranosidase